MKRYSSGMYVRLAFAVAAHLEPDILLVDEVLAVGDIVFQQKCLGAMQNIAGSGRTVIFVSHNMGAIQRLCTRGVVIDGGRIIFAGDTPDAISAFLSSISSFAEAVPMTGSLNRVIKVHSLDINGRPSIETIRIRPRAEVVIDLAVSITAAVPKAKVIISIRKNNDKIIDLHDVAVPADLPSGIARIRGTLPSYFLSPGDYSVSVLCFSSNGECAWADEIGTFSILAEASGSYDIGNMGLVHLSDRGVRISVGEKTDEMPNIAEEDEPATEEGETTYEDVESLP